MGPEGRLMRWARWWRHRWLPDNAARRAVPDDMAERLQQRIAQSEAQHSGEIVVCVEGALPNRYLARAGLDEPLDAVVRQRALAWFGKLRVWDTEHNNGVLIYLLLAERRIEVVADRGLSLCVPPDHWQAVIQPLGQALRSGEAEAGLMQAIQAVTTPLVTHFGLAPGASNANELGDRVVRV